LISYTFDFILSDKRHRSTLYIEALASAHTSSQTQDVKGGNTGRDRLLKVKERLELLDYVLFDGRASLHVRNDW
jgi:hypothetical protein